MDNTSNNMVIVIAVLVFFIFAVALSVLVLVFARHWLKAAFGGAPVSFPRIVGLRLRGAPVAMIIEAHVRLRRAGVSVTVDDLEQTYRLRGSRIRVAEDLMRETRDRLQLR